MHRPWVTAEARAKVNLRLRIAPRGADGYHPLETIFCRIDLADRVRLRRRAQPGVSLMLGGVEPAPEGCENLAVRAAELFLARAGATGGVEIELEKRVPAGAGLGGGSSDAAAVLRLLNGLVRPGAGDEMILRLAGELGADVPFLTADLPFAPAWGRGDRFIACSPPPPRPMLVLVPELRVSTTQAYAAWDETHALESRGEPAGEPGPGSPLESVDLASWEVLRELAVNDFEPVIFSRHPEIAETRARLSDSGALIALLCGSGSALFGVYPDERTREAAAAGLLRAFRRLRLVSACGPV